MNELNANGKGSRFASKFPKLDIFFLSCISGRVLPEKKKKKGLTSDFSVI